MTNKSDAPPPPHPLLDEGIHEERSRRVLEAICHGCDADDELDDDGHDGVPDDEDDPRGHRLAASALALVDQLEQHIMVGGDPSKLTDVLFPDGLPTASPVVAVADLDSARIELEIVRDDLALRTSS